MSGTEKTPLLPDLDTEFLGKILDYSSTAMTKLSMVGFKALWAEKFFGNPTADKTDVLDEWEFKVARSRTSPVYLTDENGDVKWIFPPIIGELMVGTTATMDSLDHKAREVRAIRNRFVSQGLVAEAQVLESLKPNAANREMLDVHMFMIRRECGYLTPEEEMMAARVLGTGATGTLSNSTGEVSYDDWDYE